MSPPTIYTTLSLQHGPEPMTLKEFAILLNWTALLRGHDWQPDWRIGQTYFNVLDRKHPEIAAAVKGSEFDPFYDDAVIPHFLAKLSRDFVQGSS